MKSCGILTLLLFILATTRAQTITQKLQNAVKVLQADVQLKHAAMSLYVVESKSGKVVYALNEQMGLAPASTQKIFTSIAAYDILGKAYTYKTVISYNGGIDGGILKGNLYITGSGDPTFGSWRYLQTKREVILDRIITDIRKAGIGYIDGDIIIDDSKFSYQPIPGGWIWDDIGNYYGAGSWGINWNENQYDLLLEPGNKEGDTVRITGTDPDLANVTMHNFLKTGKPGSGDNGYIYLTPYATEGFAEGTVPAGKKSFTLSGALPYPAMQFRQELENACIKENLTKENHVIVINPVSKPAGSYNNVISTLYSPVLDSMNYFFLQKSINLYGEALLKTMAYQVQGTGSTNKGVELLKEFWGKQGIENAALNIMDGSGLSPQNRVTANAFVKALQYATGKSWFNDFYKALPVYNNMHMKSGTISGTKAYAGYHTSGTGTAYTFAVIINNYDSGAGSIVSKMYKVLDVLK